MVRVVIARYEPALRRRRPWHAKMLRFVPLLETDDKRRRPRALIQGTWYCLAAAAARTRRTYNDCSFSGGSLRLTRRNNRIAHVAAA
jgi:hypothetical protein